ncbi:FecR family protein [Formosa sediminum]|uniref:FecR family protein n=1 Tax=Formosa sediminum TaxID=2594004 RepID=A0A516GUU9_9FLAO|nr:FecR family protein [Formosa sediminum]QDO95160.1 FecR family protein [Formosa sediminum]
MTEKEFKRILKKYETGIASQEDIKLIDAFFEAMNKTGDSPKEFKYNLALKNRIHQNIEKKKQPKRFSRIGIAASIIILLSFSLFFMLKSDLFSTNKSEYLIANIIKTTPSGTQESVQLPDGTMVILNANSTLEYPKVFNDSIRFVKLKGQAFFNVTKNPDQPFVIKTQTVSTRVLGTSFNVTTLDSIVEVIVNTGLVNVSSQTNSVLVKPNQKVTYNNNTNTLSKTAVNAELNTLWWKEEVVLEQVKILELAKALEQVYKIPFVITNKNIEQMYFYSLRIRKDESLDDLISRINFINEVKLIKHNSMIEITKD